MGQGVDNRQINLGSIRFHRSASLCDLYKVKVNFKLKVDMQAFSLIFVFVHLPSERYENNLVIEIPQNILYNFHVIRHFFFKFSYLNLHARYRKIFIFVFSANTKPPETTLCRVY